MSDPDWLHTCLRFIRTDHEIQKLIQHMVSIISAELVPYLYIVVAAQLIMLFLSAGSLIGVIIMYQQIAYKATIK